MKKQKKRLLTFFYNIVVFSTSCYASAEVLSDFSLHTGTGEDDNSPYFSEGYDSSNSSCLSGTEQHLQKLAGLSLAGLSTLQQEAKIKELSGEIGRLKSQSSITVTGPDGTFPDTSLYIARQSPLQHPPSSKSSSHTKTFLFRGPTFSGEFSDHTHLPGTTPVHRRDSSSSLDAFPSHTPIPLESPPNNLDNDAIPLFTLYGPPAQPEHSTSTAVATDPSDSSKKNPSGATMSTILLSGTIGAMLGICTLYFIFHYPSQKTKRQNRTSIPKKQQFLIYNKKKSQRGAIKQPSTKSHHTFFNHFSWSS